MIFHSIHMHLAGYSPLQSFTNNAEGLGGGQASWRIYGMRWAGVLAVSAQCLTQSCQGPGGRTSFLDLLACQPLVSSKVLGGQASWRI